MTSTALWLAFGSIAFVLLVLWAMDKLAKQTKKPLQGRPQYGADDHFATPVITDAGAHSCGSDGGGASCDGGGH
jgi:hypothetical protein